MGGVQGTQGSPEVALGGVIPASGTGYCHPRSGHGQDHAVGCSHMGTAPHPPGPQGRVSVSDSKMLVVGRGARGTGSPVLGQVGVGREEIRA